MRTLLAILALFLAMPAAARALEPPQPPLSGPAEAVEAFHRALAAGDREAVLALLDEELVVFEQGFAERSRAEYATTHLPADMRFAAAVSSTVTSRRAVAGDGLAWVMSETTVKGAFDGRPVDRLSLETMVLRLGPGGWKIVHIHWSSRAPD